MKLSQIKEHFNKDGYLLLFGRIYKLSEMIER